MAKQGHVWMCFTDPNADSTDQSQGSHLLKVYTQTAAQITDNILSVSRMVKLLGFELRFRPTGWEGFTKKDPSTGNYIKIPVFYDADDMLWYIYFSVGSTRRRAMQNARTDDGVQRQVVDVTGSEWTPNICYAGNAMLRRSRRIQSKEQIIGDITADQNTGKVGNDGTSTVPQITGKRPTDTGTVQDTGNILPLPSTGTSTGKVPANTSTGSVPLNTTSTDNGTEAISIPTEAPEPIDTRRGTIVGSKADATTISNKDSKESGGEMQMLEAKGGA